MCLCLLLTVRCQDDIIDDVDSFLAAAETLKERGAYKIFVMATHGLLSSDAPRLIEESAIDEVTAPGRLGSSRPRSRDPVGSELLCRQSGSVVGVVCVS